MDDYAQTMMAQRISMISGVAQVQVFGSQKYAVRAKLNPRALASKGIGIDEVADAVADANVNLPTGTLYGATKAFTVQATGQLNDAAAYRPVIVAYRGGLSRPAPGTGQRSLTAWRTTRSQAGIGDTRAIILAIQRQPGTNTVEVVDSIKQLIPTFRSRCLHR